jgi:hypothetical protein
VWPRKGLDFAAVGKNGRSGKGVVGRELRSVGVKSCAWVLGMHWRIKGQK